jgi:hypothetical protein
MAITGEGAWEMSATVVPKFASVISQVEELSITHIVVPQLEYLLTLPNLKTLVSSTSTFQCSAYEPTGADSQKRSQATDGLLIRGFEA